MTEKFSDYQLAEYNNIAEAHFKTIELISSFFRYYLIIMALPITLFSTVLKVEDLDLFMYKDLLSIFSIIISILGYFVLLYVINLRLDALLYARTVNSIRKYFFDSSGLEITEAIKYRTLPQSNSHPSYIENRYFLPVIICFAIFNSLYLYLGFSYFDSTYINNITSSVSIFLQNTILSFFVPYYKSIIKYSHIIFAFLHYFSYHYLASYRQHAYLRSNIMGVDIDGVLNKHREQFCEITDKPLRPNQITSLPIHDDPRIGITREDEKEVFHQTRYWTTMPVFDDAPHILLNLKNSFNMKIHIFTHRPWPIIDNNFDLLKTWRDESLDFFIKSYLNRKNCWWQQNYCKFLKIKYDVLMRLPKIYINFYPFKISIKKWLSPIQLITKTWMRNNNIVYDKLVIERGSEDVPDPSTELHNRFYYSRKNNNRYFVEDDYVKAIKLSYICDVVFLITHPYNKHVKLPTNIIRVNDWNEIYQNIKRLS